MREKSFDQDKRYLKQMIYFAEVALSRLEKAKEYGIDIRDEMVVDSLAMNIGQIGEQLDSSKLSVELQEHYAGVVNWRDVKRFRDKAYHHYGTMDQSIILSIATRDLPELIDNLRFILRDIEKRES